MRMAFVPILALAVAGCSTSIRSTSVASDEASVPSGVLYYLPATAVDASMAFLPKSCTFNTGKISLGYDIVDAVVKYSYVPDSSQQYLFDYTKLNSKLKITSASVTLYASGGIKSINTDVDDRSAEVIGAIGGTALNLVKASVFVPGTGVASVPEKGACPTVITRQLDDLARLRDELAKATAADNQLAAELSQLDNAKQALSALKTKAAAAPADEGLKAEVVNATAKVAQLEDLTKGRKPAATEVRRKMTPVLKVLTGSARALFVPTVNAECQETTMTGGAYLRGFLEVAKPDEISALEGQIDVFGKDAIFSGLVCVTIANGTPRRTVQKLERTVWGKIVKSGGIVYRQPVVASLTVAKTRGAYVDFEGERWIPVPQYGTIASLDLRNGTFDKNTLKLAFAEDGSLATLDFTAQSSAERGMLAAQNLSKSYLDIVMARENAEVARDAAADAKEKQMRAAEIARYDDALKLLNAQEALKTKAIGTDPVQARIAATELETSLVKKQIELETARRQLERLKAGAP